MSTSAFVFICMPIWIFLHLPPQRAWAAAGRLALLALGLSIRLVGAEPPATDMTPAQLTTAFQQQVVPLINTYCIACHGPEKHKGDLNLKALASGSAILTERATWKACAAKVLARVMPPDQEKHQPADDERNQLIAWVTSLKRLAPTRSGTRHHPPPVAQRVRQHPARSARRRPQGRRRPARRHRRRGLQQHHFTAADGEVPAGRR
jgi:mono/diheme cytochrome c family protein